MPALSINRRKLKDALRLKFEGGQSHQQIAQALDISKGVVTTYVGLAVAAALDWAAIAAMDEATLERHLLASLRPSDSYAAMCAHSGARVKPHGGRLNRYGSRRVRHGAPSACSPMKRLSTKTNDGCDHLPGVA